MCLSDCHHVIRMSFLVNNAWHMDFNIIHNSIIQLKQDDLKNISPPMRRCLPALPLRNVLQNAVLPVWRRAWGLCVCVTMTSRNMCRQPFMQLFNLWIDPSRVWLPYQIANKKHVHWIPNKLSQQYVYDKYRYIMYMYVMQHYTVHLFIAKSIWP